MEKVTVPKMLDPQYLVSKKFLVPRIIGKKSLGSKKVVAPSLYPLDNLFYNMQTPTTTSFHAMSNIYDLRESCSITSS